MNSKIGFLVVVLLIILGSIAYLIYMQSNQSPTQITNDLKVNPTLEPTPSLMTTEEISGEIQEIVGPVDYKNSILIKVGNTSGSANVYLTTDTIITGPNGASLNRSSIREGSNISITAIPVEGGFEAISATFINLSTTSPTESIRKLSPTMKPLSPTVQE